ATAGWDPVTGLGTPNAANSARPGQGCAWQLRLQITLTLLLMRHMTAALVVCSCGLSVGLAACRSSQSAPRGPDVGPPPVAARRSKTITVHGDSPVDDYFWLRDKADPRVMEYLKAE